MLRQLLHTQMCAREQSSGSQRHAQYYLRLIRYFCRVARGGGDMRLCLDALHIAT